MRAVVGVLLLQMLNAGHALNMSEDVCGWVELESGVYCDPSSGGRWMHVADFLLSGAGTSKWL